MIKANEHELTAVLNADRFDDYPGGIREEDKPRWRKFRQDYHAAQRLELLTDFPLQIDFELNSTCQLSCGFCVHGQERVQKRMIDFKDFARVIDEASEHGLCSIKMNYINEPLLRRDLPLFIEYAKRKGVLNVYFASNGVLLSREMAQRLIDVGLSKIMISLDATTPETFKTMRRSDKFEEIVANIHGLLALREELGLDYPLVRVNFLRTKLNILEAEDFIAYWTGKADMIGFQTQVQLPGIDSDLIPRADLGVDEEFRCSFPFKQLVVDASGAILPCCTFSGRLMPLGTIHEMTVKEAWDSAQMASLKEIHLHGNYRDNPICAHCVGGG